MSITRVQQALSAAFFGWLIPVSASAVQIFPECASSVGFGNCSTCDFLALFANFAEIILQFVGVAVLLMVIIGGLMWIMSAGNPTLVQKGQSVLVGALVGALIVLGGYFMVNGVIAGLVGDGDFNDVQLFGTDWAEFCTDTNPKAVVSQCTGKPDGTSCSDTSCGENCACLSESCQPICAATWKGMGASCVADQGACNADDGGAGQCPNSAPFCCVDKEADPNEETPCEGAADGSACTTWDCDDSGVCVCDGGFCVNSCDYIFSKGSEIGTCFASESDCSDAAGNVEDTSGTYCADTGTPVCCTFEI